MLMAQDFISDPRVRDRSIFPLQVTALAAGAD